TRPAQPDLRRLDVQRHPVDIPLRLQVFRRTLIYHPVIERRSSKQATSNARPNFHLHRTRKFHRNVQYIPLFRSRLTSYFHAV
uniref:Uncharacterized protein n=1 Tax=Ciona savignyi TaxID=51511 RepID=H2YY82_CIOSA